MAAQVLLQRAVARLGVKLDRRDGGVSGAGERVLRLLYSIVTKRGRGAEIEAPGAGTSIGISGQQSLFVSMHYH